MFCKLQCYNLYLSLLRRATEIEWRYTEQGDKVRISKRTGLIIPIPITATETIDYKTKAGYAGVIVLKGFFFR